MYSQCLFVITYDVLVNKDINISNSVGHHHWRILVKADKAADISSGVLYSRGMFF